MTSDMIHIPAVGNIPIKNIWLLMLYASDLYRNLPHSQSVAVEDNPDDIPNLIAELLTQIVERRMRRNLTFGYHHRQAEMAGVRGRIELLRTERYRLLQRGRVACSFEELTIDTPSNRFVKEALNILSRTIRDSELARRCGSVSTQMERAGVSGNPASSNRRTLSSLLSRLGRLDSDDRQMLSAARLAFDLALPTEEPGAFHLPAPDREHQIWRLFELAVGGFYNITLEPRGWRVYQGHWHQWPVSIASSGIGPKLPSMETDILLEHPDPPVSSRIIIDTKFTRMFTTARYGGQILRSAHIYQMYAYLRSQEQGYDPMSLNATGVLLYPSIGEDFYESVLIQGHEIRFTTVDLSADTQTIREQLLRIPTTNPLERTILRNVP